ncbi:FAD-containing oxidoreductase [Lacibacterium aquatile]|uniref:FAD-containing oxidoreductase n=1 Tax=Lacibacterium aquatile TaxID=1168082 RepID=A0ABW5DNC9_9PROT
MSRFDAIIIGGGQAGPSLAGRLTAAGRKVALIERKFLGGTCVNVGCMPTKALVASARAAHVARTGGAYGVTLPGPISIDMPTVKARADQIIQTARGNVAGWLGGMEGLRLIEGHARFTSAHSLLVNGEKLEADHIFINVGGRTSIPDMPGLSEIPYLTSSTILQLDELPSHLVIIGGSYIGLEFAQMYRRFGAEVTVIERGPRLVGREDEDISDAISDILQAEGITVLTTAGDLSFAKADSGVAVTTAQGRITGSHLLLAVGRRPNTDDLGLEAAGIATDARGYITVDDRLETTVPGVYALGDCNGRGAFTHTAYNDFEIVAANLLDGDDRKVSQRIPAYALYIDPPLGRVGLSEREAIASGRPVLVSKRPMSRVGRAIERGETKGFIKIVADAETQQLLGAAFLGIEGDEAIHGIIGAMHAGTPYPTLQWAVPIHPTVSELIPTILGDLKPPA